MARARRHRSVPRSTGEDDPRSARPPPRDRGGCRLAVSLPAGSIISDNLIGEPGQGKPVRIRRCRATVRDERSTKMPLGRRALGRRSVALTLEARRPAGQQAVRGDECLNRRSPARYWPASRNRSLTSQPSRQSPLERVVRADRPGRHAPRPAHPYRNRGRPTDGVA